MKCFVSYSHCGMLGSPLPYHTFILLLDFGSSDSFRHMDTERNLDCRAVVLSVLPGPAASASPMNFVRNVNSQALIPYILNETMGVRPNNLHLTSSSADSDSDLSVLKLAAYWNHLGIFLTTDARAPPPMMLALIVLGCGMSNQEL